MATWIAHLPLLLKASINTIHAYRARVASFSSNSNRSFDDEQQVLQQRMLATQINSHKVVEM